MKKEFVLDPRSPKRLTVTWQGQLASARVLLVGQEIMAFASKADFLRGTTVKLPDGSILSVRYGPIEGLPLLKGVHVIHNGSPVPGSAADPVPQWAWIFIGLSILIPVISLGGAIPVLIAGAGVGGTLTVSRMKRWSTALRVGMSALITVGCWTGFLVVAAFIGTLKGNDAAKQPAAAVVSANSAPDQLIHKIGVTYYNHGYKQQAIDEIKDNLYDHCEKMQPAQCVDYLNQALREAQNAADAN